MTRSQRILTAFWCTAGALHFVRPKAYEAIMPPQIPMHREAVALSGAAEILGGLAVVHPATRGFARWWLLGVLAAVFPANIHMALNPEQVAEHGVPADRLPRWALLGRLPLQFVCALWVWRATERR